MLMMLPGMKKGEIFFAPPSIKARCVSSINGSPPIPEPITTPIRSAVSGVDTNVPLEQNVTALCVVRITDNADGTITYGLYVNPTVGQPEPAFPAATYTMAGTLPTHTPLFVFFLIGVVLIVGALTFVPALALGPVVEHLMLHAGAVR